MPSPEEQKKSPVLGRKTWENLEKTRRFGEDLDVFRDEIWGNELGYVENER